MEFVFFEDAPYIERAKPRSFEQLSVGGADTNPANPISPFAEKAISGPIALSILLGTDAPPEPAATAVELHAVAPVLQTNPAPPMTDPAEAIVDPVHRLPTRSLSDPAVPARSRLSPSQRAQLRRSSAGQKSEANPTYVTYTF
jgi:hypothetical protein